jgi:hypothetical protein
MTVYTVSLVDPDTDGIVHEQHFDSLGGVSDSMHKLGNIDHKHDPRFKHLLDEHGELTISVKHADGSSLSDQEKDQLAAIFREHGGGTPDEDEVNLYRDGNQWRWPA